MRIARFVPLAGIALMGASFAAEASAQRVTSNFGYRKDPFHGGAKFHAGMDFGAATGTPVYATGDGYIRRAGWNGGYGNLVEMENGFGFQTRFGHLSKVLVQPGQFVRRGQMVGLVGSTGRSTAPHLHYEVRINGRPTQPSNYMQIVFQQQPDWRMVQASLFTTQAYQQRAPVVAFARAVPKAGSSRVTGDIDLDLSGTSATMTPQRSGASSFGHVSGPNR